MQKYFDQINNRLVYLGHQAEDQYWDQHWKNTKFQMKMDSFVVNVTAKYLPKGSHLLEGGCGLGAKVYSLHHSGYKIVGLDYAQDTIKMLSQNFPDLNVKLGDVRELPFKDAEFDGYWSFGVIEHFYDGYDKISDEMKRVLKNDGYLFMTVPYMSFLRRLKAKLGLYPEFIHKNFDAESGKFYQFALPKEGIISHFQEKGFNLLSHRKFDGVKGFKDEIPSGGILQKLYDSHSFPLKVVRKLLSLILSPFSPHISLYIFQKKI